MCCGFDYQLDGAETAERTAISVGADRLADPAGAQRHRPANARAPDLWSPLEYACHVRDVLLVQPSALLAARRTDRPTFEPMGPRRRVEHDEYAGRTRRPSRQLRDAAAMFVNDLARLRPDEWERTLMYNYPVEMQRSLRWVAEHTEHEVQHHLLDVREQLN